MSDSANVLDQAVAAAKSTYATVDPANLKRFLEGLFASGVTITDIHGGAEKSGSSSGIIIFDAEIGTGPHRVMKKLVLRYDPQSDNRLFFEYDLDSQYTLLKMLEISGLPLPKVYGLDAKGDQLGVRGFVMDCVDGEPIPTSLFTSGPLVEATDEERLVIYRNILKTLVGIHKLDYKKLGLEHFAKEAPGNSAAEKLINWWWRTWEWVKPSYYDRLVPVRQWLLDNIPEEPSPVLMHGDPNLGNYMLKNGQVSAILDWELSSVGSPELDLAVQILSLEAQMPLADKLTVRPPTQEQWLALYHEEGGRPLKNLDYYRKHAAYQIVICFGSMSRYLPPDVRLGYEQMAEFFWAVIEKN